MIGDRMRQPLRAFQENAARPPSRWQQIVLVLVGAVVTYGIWDERGAAAGLVAAVVWATICLGAAFNHGAMMAWSRRHVAFDALLVVPLTFLALAYVTGISLPICAAVALAAGALLVPFAVARRVDAPA